MKLIVEDKHEILEVAKLCWFSPATSTDLNKRRMEHAPYSPIASSSRVPYQIDSPLIPTSDFGEREESEAASGGEGYWIERVGHRSKGKAREQQQAATDALSSDDEVGTTRSFFNSLSQLTTLD